MYVLDKGTRFVIPRTEMTYPGHNMKLHVTAADAVKAFHPKVAIPYHYKGQDTAVFKKALDGTGIDVRLLDWYPS